MNKKTEKIEKKTEVKKVDVKKTSTFKKKIGRASCRERV